MKKIRTIILLILIAECTTLSSCKKNLCIQTKWSGNCICTMEYSPVCGCDGKTYGNACTAECQGITEYVKGECK